MTSLGVLIFKYPYSYGALLIQYNNVTVAHAEIANFLWRNAPILSILRVDNSSHKSNDIFGNLTTCAKWAKIN